jgi:hypothetical protein
MAAVAADTTTHKRPRSPSATDQPLPPAKVQRTHVNQLQINYLARQHKETIPLVTPNEKLTEIATLIGKYDGVLQRHESIAGNLGACPLGPILLKRFDRLFDGPPRILKTHGREGNVTWLDVVEFAQNKPEQFNLEKMRNGIRVCQFYTKQCRVEISEEDFVLIASGMPQKLIPPQPILEDEEKELGVMDLLDRNLGQVIQLADQVSGRARQLIHKMKGRRTAILARRETESAAQQPQLRSTGSPSLYTEANGSAARPLHSVETTSPPTGFTAVNNRQISIPENPKPSSDDPFPGAGAGNVTYINGRSIKGASPTERAEMMKKFMSSADQEPLGHDTVRRSSMGSSSRAQMQLQSEPRPRSGSTDYRDRSSLVAIPGTPSQLMPQIKSPFLERDDGGPFKSEMVSRMESMHRGERVIPPCDRCRRLHMDCLKNLTACMGCTKKHAKCSWKDVRPDELHEHGQGMEAEHDHHIHHDSHAEHSSPPASIAEISRQVEENARPTQEILAQGRPEAYAQNAMAYQSSRMAHSPGEDTVDTVMGNAEQMTREPTPPKPEPPLATEALRPSSPPHQQQQQQEPEQIVQPVHAMDTTGPAAQPPPAAALPQFPVKPQQASPPPPAPQSKFDLKPPALVQGMHEAARQYTSPPPPRYQSYSTYPPHREQAPSRQLDPDEDDEGDRLQQLARQVYRSASQSAKPQET